MARDPGIQAALPGRLKLFHWIVTVPTLGETVSEQYFQFIIPNNCNGWDVGNSLEMEIICLTRPAARLEHPSLYNLCCSRLELRIQGLAPWLSLEAAQSGDGFESWECSFPGAALPAARIPAGSVAAGLASSLPGNQDGNQPFLLCFHFCSAQRLSKQILILALHTVKHCLDELSKLFHQP